MVNVRLNDGDDDDDDVVVFWDSVVDGEGVVVAVAVATGVDVPVMVGVLGCVVVFPNLNEFRSRCRCVGGPVRTLIILFGSR